MPRHPAQLSKRVAALAGSVLTVAGLFAAPVIAPTPPVAPKKEHREVRHGATVVDNYFWLREKENPEVISYLKSENAYTDAMTANLKPFQDKLYGEMLSHLKQTDLSVPAERHGYFYYSRTVEGQQYPIFCRRKGSMTAPEEVILDENELGKGRKFVGVGTRVYSDDENLLAYGLDYSGYRQYTLQVKDLRSGQTMPDKFERVTSIEWAADGKTLFLSTEDAVTKRSNKIFRHVVGTDKYEPIYEEADELYTVHVRKSLDNQYLMVQCNSTDTSETRILRADHPADNFQVFLPREKKHRYSVEHREGQFYIRTNKDAKNFQIVSAPDKDPSPANWKPFVAARPDTLIEAMEFFETFAVVAEKNLALTKLRVYTFGDNKWQTVAVPEPIYAISPAENSDYHATKFRYQYQSFVTPQSVYDYDVRSAQSTLRKRQEVPGGYDPSQYVSERLWATARDGVKVPLSIVYKKGFQRNGTAPVFLYAYGSYGIPTPVSFSSARLSLLDRGVPYVIAHIRGGNELGEQWREDGMLMKKKNTFTDFIDSAEYLIKEKWASKDRVMIEGGSAGGLLMGAVVNMRPDLFRAVHAAVPFVDVMNTMLDATLPLTVGEYLEWGNPNEQAAYDYMKTYSPYDNLEKRPVYPAMLVTTSLNDSQVGYWEPAKYVARLRTLKTDPRPLLLKVKLDPAGHGGASGRYDRLKDQAFEYAWMLTQVGVTE